MDHGGRLKPTATQVGMATAPDPRSPMGISSIRGCKWGNFSPRGDVNGQKSIPVG